MKIDNKSIRRWAKLGSRPTFGLAITQLAKEHSDVYVMTADVSTSAGLDRYKRSCASQFIDVGIAEQNMMVIATGLSNEGSKVYTTTFAPFQSMRCLEQIRVYQGYMNKPLVMIGLASGLYHSYLGNTHCCFEDVAVLRGIPNISIVTPADTTEIVKVIQASYSYDKALYIRLMDNKNAPIIYNDDYEFEIGKANSLREGKDIALLACGTMVAKSLEVADILEKYDVHAKVIDFHTVKPLDKAMLDEIGQNYKYIATIEEHNIIGGLSSAIAEYYMQKENKPIQIMIGIDDFYPHASAYEDALKQCGLMSSQIVERILGELRG